MYDNYVRPLVFCQNNEFYKTFKLNMLLTLETYKLCVENLKVIIKKNTFRESVLFSR